MPGAMQPKGGAGWEWHRPNAWAKRVSPKPGEDHRAETFGDHRHPANAGESRAGSQRGPHQATLPPSRRSTWRTAGSSSSSWCVTSTKVMPDSARA